MIWGDQTLGQQMIWGDQTLLGQQIIWGDQTLGQQMIWGDADTSNAQPDDLGRFGPRRTANDSTLLTTVGLLRRRHRRDRCRRRRRVGAGAAANAARAEWLRSRAAGAGRRPLPAAACPAPTRWFSISDTFFITSALLFGPGPATVADRRSTASRMSVRPRLTRRATVPVQRQRAGDCRSGSARRCSSCSSGVGAAVRCSRCARRSRGAAARRLGRGLLRPQLRPDGDRRCAREAAPRRSRCGARTSPWSR